MKTTVDSKKLHVIEEFLKVQNEDVIDKIESILKEENMKVLQEVVSPAYSEREFNEMIDRAEEDAAQGKVYTSKELKKQIQSWK